MIQGIFVEADYLLFLAFPSLACLIAPCASALARGCFSALIAKERITWLCSCWRWGSNPPEKNPSTPWFHSYPEHSLSLLVSSVTSNLLTTGPQVGTCCVLPKEQGSLTSAGVFQLMVLSLLAQCSNYQRCYLCNFLWQVMERFP